MPKYRFICPSCDKEVSKFVSIETEKYPCECGHQMDKQFPTINGQQVTELVDSATGVTWKQDQQILIEKRKEEHYWEVEVPRLVQKYSLETCLEQGWLTYNEKGELVIGKAPSKR